MESLIKYWQDNNEILHKLKANSSNIEKLSIETFSFLSNYGLPSGALPGLSFDLIKEYKLQMPNELFRIDYEDQDDYEYLNKYLTFGSNDCGDPICIDLINEEQIVYLNHDNNFEPVFMNTNIKKFALSLTVYHDFINSLLSSKMEKSSHRKFSGEEFEIIKNRFMEIDSNSLKDNSFWKGELGALLWERDNE